MAVTVWSWDVGGGGWKGDVAGVEKFGSQSQRFLVEFECDNVLGIDMVDVVAHECAQDTCPNWSFLGARLSWVNSWERPSRESEDCWSDEFGLVEVVNQHLLTMSVLGEFLGSSFCCLYFTSQAEFNILRSMSKNPLSSPCGIVESCRERSYCLYMCLLDYLLDSSRTWIYDLGLIRNGTSPTGPLPTIFASLMSARTLGPLMVTSPSSSLSTSSLQSCSLPVVLWSY